MSLYTVLFYVLAAVILGATGFAVTRRNLVYAMVYLILSFFGTGMLFYLFGAPLLAALEIIIYAGAIMVLFLFIVMMLKVERSKEPIFRPSQWVPAAAAGLVYLVVGAVLVFRDPSSRIPLEAAWAKPREFGQYLFQRHWLSIEIVSLLLLIALIGALHLGRIGRKRTPKKIEDQS